jgi:hypothetical protein
MQDQAAALIEKSEWQPLEAQFMSHNDSVNIAAQLGKLEDVFTKPAYDNNGNERFKTRGELLNALRAAHCVLTENGEETVMTWKAARCCFKKP